MNGFAPVSRWPQALGARIIEIGTWFKRSKLVLGPCHMRIQLTKRRKRRLVSLNAESNGT